MGHLTHYVAQSTAFDFRDKLKAILFFAGVKPATYVHLRVQRNYRDKTRFKELLKQAGVPHNTGRAKGFEEIRYVKGNKAIWRKEGIWYGHDLFQNKTGRQLFDKYVKLLKQQKHTDADRTAGRLYGYPRCCIEAYIKEHKPTYVRKKYTYYDYYKRLHQSDKNFPFIFHVPCTPTCSRSKKLNQLYHKTIKQHAPRVYRAYTAKRTYKVPVIIDTESNGLWAKQNGHDYVVITQKPIEKKHWLISWLTKKSYERGTILDATVTLQYDYATITNTKKTGTLEDFHHERHFTPL